MQLLRELRGPRGSPFHFTFSRGSYYSGGLAFAHVGQDSEGDAGAPAHARPLLLLVADAMADAVHLVDVVAGAHLGPLYPAGAQPEAPRGVAASATTVAVSAWKHARRCDHTVSLFDARTRRPLRVLGGVGGPADGCFDRPWGLALSGALLAVADNGNDRVTEFRVEDGAFVRHAATGLGFAAAVVAWPGGWVVSSGQGLACIPATGSAASGNGAVVEGLWR